ncbi:hypothetical protein J2T17_007424 [Paenibacillus mucilaginosus]|uniref:RICIN domain-containing protein n=1 Tax=Paenibacillus mucilaginosus TaxID=61624 RepID=UPI003D23DD5E
MTINYINDIFGKNKKKEVCMLRSHLFILSLVLTLLFSFGSSANAFGGYDQVFGPKTMGGKIYFKGSIINQGTQFAYGAIRFYKVTSTGDELISQTGVGVPPKSAYERGEVAINFTGGTNLPYGSYKFVVTTNTWAGISGNMYVSSDIVSGGVYQLTNIGSEMALDVEGGSTVEGTNTQIWNANGTPAQTWRVISNSDGTYKLINTGSGQVLDAEGGGTTDGTKVQIWRDNETVAQKWRIVANGDGTFKLINVGSGKVLDVEGGGTVSGTKVQLWTDNGTAAQKWLLSPV